MHALEGLEVLGADQEHIFHFRVGEGARSIDKNKLEVDAAIVLARPIK